MRTVVRIARRDLVDAWRDRTGPVLLTLVLALSFASLATAWTRHWAVAEDQRAAQAEARRLWLTQGDKNPHGAAHFGSFAFKVLSPLAMVDRGLDQYLGQWVRLETHSQHEAGGRPADDVGELVRFGQLTPGFLVQWIGPLFIILIGFGTIIREREHGTLTLLLAQGVRPWQLAAGKLAGLSVASLPLLAPLAVLAAIAAVHPLFSPEVLARALTLFALHALYLFAFAALAVAVSAWSRSSPTALATLLGIWLATCVLVPRAAVLAADAFQPVPSSMAFLQGVEEARDFKYVDYTSFDSFNETFERVQQDLMVEHGVSSPAELPVNTFGYALEATEQEGQRAYDVTYGEVERAFARQGAVHRFAHALSPWMSVHGVTMGLTGTGLDEHLHFVASAEAYRRGMMHTLNMDLAHNTRDPNYDVRRRNTGDYTRGVDLWATVPDFVYEPLSFRDVLSRHAAGIAWLSAWLAMGLAAATSGVLRACARP